MKKHNLYIAVILVIFMIACGEEKKETEQLSDGTHKVKVVEKMDAAGYSYLNVEEDSKTYWIAVPTMNIEPGEYVYYSRSMEMTNFKSNTLDRTFDSILFVEDASMNAGTAGAGSMQMPEGHPQIQSSNKMPESHPDVKTAGKMEVEIEPVSGGSTVADIFKNKSELAGKPVVIHGKVTKFNGGIMGRNWIHIQDGTDYNGSFDLLVTSQEEFKVGDVVTLEGKVAVDQDFGAGYAYDVLIEEAAAKK
ncbi:MAG: hypothetical protein K9J16_10525 [Melioribacteraceae bacterium]|nr:hypothetical protein [Melioribacteraceae bacterium]MCF8354473.1 hypothetical protein [Melioribacteraceae bacterium]MCF8394083.1 hypothetical protein [Melioribacteraceae bacterium]MCF8419864.1 hypothetical protein [Melioribacteraceae bacterium]